MIDMFSEVVVEPGIQIFGFTFIGYEVCAVGLPRRIRKCRLRHCKGPNQHRLLADIGSCKRLEFTGRQQQGKVAIPEFQRCFEFRKFRKIELQHDLRRRSVV